MLQLSADGLKNHIFAGHFRNAADSSADARAYDSRCRGGMLMLPRPLTAYRAMCRLQGRVSQDAICESPHAARMPRRNAGVLNAFDLLQQTIELGRVRNGCDASLRDRETSFVEAVQTGLSIPVRTLLVSSTAASRHQQGFRPTRLSSPSFFLAYGQRQSRLRRKAKASKTKPKETHQPLARSNFLLAAMRLLTRRRRHTIPASAHEPPHKAMAIDRLDHSAGLRGAPGIP